MFFNTTRKKHRKLRRLWWVGGDPEVSPRLAPPGSAAGTACITFGYQPKASGKDTDRLGHGPAPGLKGYRPCRRPLVQKSGQIEEMEGYSHC